MSAEPKPSIRKLVVAATKHALRDLWARIDAWHERNRSEMERDRK